MTLATQIQMRSSSISRTDYMKYQHYNAIGLLNHSSVYLLRYAIYHYGLEDVNSFLDRFERDVLEESQFQALDIALRAMSARWRVHIRTTLQNGKSVEG